MLLAIAIVLGFGIGSAVLDVQSASATPVSLGAVQAQQSNHVGDAGATGTNTGTTTGYCIRYAPPNSNSSVGPTDWVAGGSEALTAHGRGGNNCPNNLSTSSQSAIGVTPVSGSLSPEPGAYFNLGKLVHYNNPINTDGDSPYFRGTMSFKLASVSSTPFNFNWWLWETPNSGSDPRDQFKLLTQAADQVVTIGGVQYKIVIYGFTALASATDSCPASPSGSVVNQWFTVEGAQTGACLYAQLNQYRPLTIVKKIAGDVTSSTAFNFASTSSLSGTDWANGSFALTPASQAANATKSGSMVQGESVTVTETIPTDTRWALTSIQCVDGTGAALGAWATTNLATGRVSLSSVPAAATAAAAPITCTYTNTYTGRAALTLNKTVQGGAASPSAWTLSATGPSTLSGASGVTSSTLRPGSYTLSESGGVAGYLLQGWVCQTATGGAVTVTNNTFTLADGANVTCTATNRYLTGALRIQKSIADPLSGFSGSSATPFTGSWTCGAMTGSFSVTTATPQTISNIPAGVSCSVTETQPSGNLKNGSFQWLSPSTDGPKTIVDGQTAVITVSNTIAQNTGNFTVAKQVLPADANTPTGGFTGGSTRAFTVNYVCTLGGQTVASGSFAVTPGTPGGPASAIPSTAVCALTETTPSTQPGDFADGSYSWNAGSFSPASVTVGVGTDAVVDSTLTNRFQRNFGTLRLTKLIDGSGYIGNGKDFLVTVNCGAGPVTHPLAVGSANSELVTQIPAGTICQVTELTPAESVLSPGYDWLNPSFGGDLVNSQVTIVANQIKQATVTNHTQAVFGQVTVTKQVSGGGVLGGTSFAISINCGVAGTWNTSLQAGQSYTTPAGIIPVGSSCQVSEATPSGGLIDGSYAWDATPVEGVQTVTIDSANQVRSVTLTNTTKRVFGQISITKVLDAPSGVSSSQSFTGTWTCSYGTDAPVGGSWSLAAGDTITKSALVGSSCAVVEDPLSSPPVPTDSSYVWGAVTYSNGGLAVVPAAGQSAGVTVTNQIVRLTGSFGISKSVRGDVAGWNGNDFTFHYVCVDPDGTEESGDLQVAGNGTVVSGPVLPAGADCTVSETGRPAALPGFSWDSISYTSPSAVTGESIDFGIGSGETVSVIAINTITAKSAQVNVTKTVTGAGGLAAGATFQANLVCSSGTFAVEFGTGGNVSPATLDIPLDSTCTVSEVAPSDGLLNDSYRWTGTPVVSPASFTVTLANVNQTIDVSITNETERVYGQVSLQKSLIDPLGVVAADREFTGTFRCVSTDGVIVSGSYSVPVSASASIIASNVLVGSECAVLDEDLSVDPSTDSSFAWNTPVFGDAVVSLAGPAALTIQNEVLRSVADVTISKTVTGQTAGFIGSGDIFPVNWQCSLDGSSEAAILGNGTVAAGGTLTIHDIPVGWDCALSEGLAPNSALKDVSFAWADPIWSDSTVTVGVEGSSATVENPIDRVYGSVVLSKVVDVPDGVVLDSAQFSGSYVCSYDGSEVTSGNWQFGHTGGTLLISDLPLTTACTMTENTPTGGLVNASWVWNTPTIADPAVVESADISPTMSVTNSVTQLFGEFSITKTVTGQTQGILADAEFSGTWTCTLGEDVRSGRWTTDSDGGTVTVSNMPQSANCVVTEDTLSQDALANESFGWAAPVISEPVSIVTGQPQAITVTNAVERVTGNVQITKTITGAVAQAELVDPSLVVSGSLVCTLGDEVQTLNWTATPSSPASVSGILVGASCVATETDAPELPVPTDPSFRWGSVSYDGNPAVVPAPREESAPTIAVTNDTFRLFGSFMVDKQLSGATEGVSETASYTFTYECVLPNEDRVEGELTAQLGNPAELIDPLPGGTVCTVSESADSLPELVSAAYEWAGVTFSTTNGGEEGDRSITFTIPFGSTGEEEDLQPTVLVTATNAITRYDVDLSITKLDGGEVAGVPAVPTDLDSDYQYTFEVGNAGPMEARGVEVRDEIPSTIAVDLTRVVVPEGWTVSLTGEDANGFGGTLVFALPEGALGVESTVQFTVWVTTAASLPRGSSQFGPSGTGQILDIVNTATVTSTGIDLDPNNNTSTEVTPVKSIDSFTTSQCQAGIPVLNYQVTPVNVQNVNPLNLVAIWWTPEAYAARDTSIPSSDTAAILADGAIQVSPITLPSGWVSGDTVSGQMPWAGAALGADGTPTAYPGWLRLPTGQWVLDPASPTYPIRESAIVEFRMNPTSANESSTPQITTCLNNSVIIPPSLAATGAQVNWLIPAAGILFALGVAFIFIEAARRRRNDAE